MHLVNFAQNGSNDILFFDKIMNVFGTCNCMDGVPLKSKTRSIPYPCGLIWDTMIDEHMMV
jgi:hypothetical protein